MKKALLCAVAISLLGTSVASARDKMTAVTYNVSVPLGDTSDFVEDISWIGIGLDIRKYVQPKRTMIGFHTAWSVLDSESSELISIEGDEFGLDVQGNQHRYLNTFPLMVTGHYYFGDNEKAARMYVGTGVGTYYIRQRFDIGVISLEEGNWHFGVMPEIGVQFPFNNMIGILQAKYNYAFASGESIGGGDGESYSYLGINAGLVWTWW